VATLDRFVEAQAGVWPDALAELKAGRKTGHWMWFVFPQITGLGRSETARFYAIADAAEARAFLAHPVLGERLREAAGALLAHRGRSAEAVLGGIDAVKLRSSMTMFEAVAPGEPVFGAVLDGFFAGQRDSETLRRLG
jgi:uncharacterized protein (DUF1810 family)